MLGWGPEGVEKVSLWPMEKLRLRQNCYQHAIFACFRRAGCANGKILMLFKANFALHYGFDGDRKSSGSLVLQWSNLGSYHGAGTNDARALVTLSASIVGWDFLQEHFLCLFDDMLYFYSLSTLHCSSYYFPEGTFCLARLLKTLAPPGSCLCLVWPFEVPVA